MSDGYSKIVGRYTYLRNVVPPTSTVVVNSQHPDHLHPPEANRARPQW